MTRRDLSLSACVLLATLTASCRDNRESASAPPQPSVRTGHIRGTVKLRGPAPVVRTEPTNKSPDVCGKSVAVTRLQLGPNNGVKQAFVYMEGVPPSGQLRSTTLPTVEQKDCTYAPHSTVLSAGAPIEIVNEDPVLHNVHAWAMTENGPQSAFNIAQPVRGQRTKIESLLQPGIVTLTCEAGHPWMTAHVLVTDHSYVAVTDGNGRFVINDVPVGTYPIKMWHEGVALKQIIASLQQFEYEEPYEAIKQVVVMADATTDVDFDFDLRQAAAARTR